MVHFQGVIGIFVIFIAISVIYCLKAEIYETYSLFI